MIEVFTRPEHSLIVRLLGLIIRLRAELTIVAILLIGRWWAWPRLVELIGNTAALLLASALVLSLIAVPASRRWMFRRWWAVTTRHRMRACFVQTRTMTHHGKLPYLVWSRPSPVGEKVRVWLPAGLSVKDLERVTAETAAACWATDVRITPSRGQAALVVVDVIRRDPLTRGALTPQVIDDLDPTEPNQESDLVEDTATGTDGVGGTVVPLPSRAALPAPPTIDPAATGTDASSGSTGARTRTRKTPAPAGTTTSTNNADGPPVTGFGGVDVSDYV